MTIKEEKIEEILLNCDDLKQETFHEDPEENLEINEVQSLIKNELEDQNSLDKFLLDSFQAEKPKRKSKSKKSTYKRKITDECFTETRPHLDPEEEKRIKETAEMFCDLCQKQLESFSHATFHYRTAHRMKGYLLCCGKKWMKRYRLLEHLNRHYNIAVPCEICGKTFATKQVLMRHLPVHEEKREYVSFVGGIKINFRRNFHKKILKEFSSKYLFF